MSIISVQSDLAVVPENPFEDLKRLKRVGIQAIDFSLHAYLKNKQLYQKELTTFFDKTEEELYAYFNPLKQAIEECDMEVFQMHMPYPNYVPGAAAELNQYLRDEVAVKSLKICKFLNCKYIVIHGFKLARFLGSEEAEWEKTREFLEYLAPFAKEYGITMCIENIYTSVGTHIIEGPCCNAKKAAKRIDAMNEKFGAEVLGFCFDTGHANLVGIDFEDFITTLGSRLKVLHIHDNDGVADLHQIPFTFTKTRENNPSTDWEGFYRGLAKIKYQGAINFETSPVLSSFPMEMREEVLGFIQKIGAYMGNQIVSREV